MAAFGYIWMIIKPCSFDWQFVAQPGKIFSGSESGVWQLAIPFSKK
jgi:hypothetical protein